MVNFPGYIRHFQFISLFISGLLASTLVRVYNLTKLFYNTQQIPKKMLMVQKS